MLEEGPQRLCASANMPSVPYAATIRAYLFQAPRLQHSSLCVALPQVDTTD